jgi:hypothetical protein
LDIITKDKRNKIKNVQAKYYPRQYWCKLARQKWERM